MSGRLGGAAAAAALLLTACVAYDPNQPAAPPIAGTYTSVISIAYRNEIESRYDSVPAIVTLPNALRIERLFSGRYVTNAGETGVIGGTLGWDGSLLITDFAQPPLTTLQGAPFLHRLYPWCDFNQIGTGTLVGQVSGDSLVITGGASVDCTYQLWERPFVVGTHLDVRIAGAR